MTNNQPEDKLNPKIQQELLNNLKVGGDLTVGNITQQNITQIFLSESPHQQELIINRMHQHFEEDIAIAGTPYNPKIPEVLSPSSTASLDAEVIPLQSSPPTTSTFEFEVVTVNPQGQETKCCPKQAQYFVEILGNGVDLEMVSIPGGKFTMGAPQEESESCEDERPRHPVSVKPFFMGRYPITQAQWRAIASLPKIKHDLDPDPSCFKGDNRPVERVNWYDAVEFCKRLSQKTGRLYRLPSEAEWEYACRAQTTTPFHFGTTITTNLANYCGQYQSVTAVDRKPTTEVGSFPANTFGLCDLHGNVWEWCADCEHENYQGAPLNGSAWLNSGNEEYRILRGGSWDCFPNLCRSASRFSEDATITDKEFGFRAVFSLT